MENETRVAENEVWLSRWTVDRFSKKETKMSKRALMVWGGWAGHEPKECVDIFAPLIEADGFDVDVRDSMDVYTDADYMSELSVVVPCWTMGSIEREQEQGFKGRLRAALGWPGGTGGCAMRFAIIRAISG